MEKKKRFANTVIVEGIVNGLGLSAIEKNLDGVLPASWPRSDVLRYIRETVEVSVKGQVFDQKTARSYLDRISHDLADIIYC